MRLTQILYRQHIGRHFKAKWAQWSKKSIVQSDVMQVLDREKIPVYEPEDILLEKRSEPKFKDYDLAPTPITFDRSHPNWHDHICYSFKDNDVLAEGLEQAKVLLKTVQVNECFPTLDSIKNCPNLTYNVQRIIMSSLLFDAEQQKLPVRKDPERPAWNFPRDFGITESRKNKLLIARLLQLIETHGNFDVVQDRAIFNSLFFSFPFEKNGNLVQFNLTGDTLVSSSKALSPIFKKENTTQIELPNLYPSDELLGLLQENIYEKQNIYPVNITIKKCHPHTLFVHYNNSEVKNIFEDEVTEDQISSRALVKAFTVAASYAKSIFGENVQELPTPITIQCVQTNGHLFNFGIFQLNTLKLNETSGIKNVWCQSDRLSLYRICSYVQGRPTLTGYNDDVMKIMWQFYYNI